MFISEIIGEEYKEWTPDKRVIISAPTGSGKTTFILEVLYPYAVSRKLRILYLVNRKVLKEQIMKQIKDIIYFKLKNPGAQNYITVMTYQSVEELLRRDPNPRSLQGYSYIICDEAHYFLKDSLFNTSTYYSYQFIARHYGSAVLIFISATIEKIKDVLHNNVIMIEDFTMSYWRGSDSNRDFRYGGLRQYDYLNIKIFGKILEIPDIILDNKNNGKWFIFINDIVEGRHIVEILKKQNIDAVFVDARYDSDEEKSLAVNQLVNEQTMRHKVIVSTSALDNGISISDRELRNLIVLAECEEDLIQMIGRRRYDGKKVNLYLCLRSLEEFSKRLHYLEQILDVYTECQGYFEKVPELVGRKVLQSPYFYERARKFLYVHTMYDNFGRVTGQLLCPNLLSIKEITYQISFYRDAIERFKAEGAYAFLKMQLSWLGLDDISETIIYENRVIEIKKHKKIIDDVLMQYIDRELDSNANKELKLQIMDSLRRLLELCAPTNVDISILDEDIRKKDRRISANKFNECMGYIGLKYCMVGGNKKPYFIKEM